VAAARREALSEVIAWSFPGGSRPRDDTDRLRAKHASPAAVAGLSGIDASATSR